MKRLAIVAAVLLGVGGTAGGQTADVSPPRPIQDNSFLLEEAYNQEQAVIQHINTFGFNRTFKEWEYSFTDEWPVGGQRHQFSLTVPVSNSESGTGFGAVSLHYRLQLVGSGDTRLAVTPRFSVILPTAALRVGGVALAFQGAVASSYAATPTLVLHTNAGVTLVPRDGSLSARPGRLLHANVGQSVIWLARQRFNVMFEATAESEQTIDSTGARTRANAVVLAPGVRWSHDLPSGLQIVPGFAFPIGLGARDGERGVLLYLSFEHQLAALR